MCRPTLLRRFAGIGLEQALDTISTDDGVARRCLDGLEKTICSDHATSPSPYVVSGGPARVGTVRSRLVLSLMYGKAITATRKSIKSLRVQMKNYEVFKKVRVRDHVYLSCLLTNANTLCAVVVLQRGCGVE